VSDVPAAAPAPEQPPQPQPLYNYMVRCLNGWSVNIASPQDLQTFWKISRADGYISGDKMAINFHTVVSVEFIGMFVPAQNVNPMTGRPMPQAVQP
jgi:hypothetical protein